MIPTSELAQSLRSFANYLENHVSGKDEHTSALRLSADRLEELEGAGSAGAMRATERHLADLQRLVFEVPAMDDRPPVRGPRPTVECGFTSVVKKPESYVYTGPSQFVERDSDTLCTTPMPKKPACKFCNGSGWVSYTAGGETRRDNCGCNPDIYPDLRDINQ